MPVRGRPRPERAPGREWWSLTTVRAILANPRYTGRQVWNRQPTAMDLLDPANTGLGHRQVQRRGLPEGWIISARPAHAALVSEADFVAVQGIRAARENTGAGRRYLLSGLLRCGFRFGQLDMQGGEVRQDAVLADVQVLRPCRVRRGSAGVPVPAPVGRPAVGPARLGAASADPAA